MPQSDSTLKKQYAAVLGHQPHISLSELAAVVPGFSLLGIEQKTVALFSSAAELDSEIMQMLGGTVFIAERITEADVSMEDVPRILCAEVSDVKKKITFGLRCFGIPKRDIKNAYRKGKEALRKQSRPSRYIGNESRPAATPLLLQADILNGKKGVELFLIGNEHGLWAGKTIAAQNINAYTWRDMEKPVRDTTVGLLPPKLAQVMLNFGAWAVCRNVMASPVPLVTSRRKRAIYTVFDPFCGTGVIPLECLLRGWNILASDVMLKAVNGTKKNIEWIRKERKILKKDVTDDVYKHDATKAFTVKNLPDMVVTETSLGLALTKRPSLRNAEKYRKESEKLQAAFLRNAAATLPGVPLVVTWPFWRMGTEDIRLEAIWDVLPSCGYQAVLPEGLRNESGKPTLLYRRKDQFVGREIAILVPKM